MIDYLAAFPIPANLLPERLRSLLQPIATDPALRVEVSCFTENDPYGPNSEAVYMLMAVVPDDGQNSIPILHCDQGQVAHSTPVLRGKGSERDFAPSVSGNDYIVASWGSGAFYTYHLAEKVWMALGLTHIRFRVFSRENKCFRSNKRAPLFDGLAREKADSCFT